MHQDILVLIQIESLHGPFGILALLDLFLCFETEEVAVAGIFPDLVKKRVDLLIVPLDRLKEDSGRADENACYFIPGVVALSGRPNTIDLFS
jgi:hypothetical protein